MINNTSVFNYLNTNLVMETHKILKDSRTLGELRELRISIISSLKHVEKNSHKYNMLFDALLNVNKAIDLKLNKA